MPDRLFYSVMVMVLAVMASGCASKKITARGYIDTKYRVDQEIPQGNVGNWQGAPDAVDTAKKQTRKVYVLEVTKAAPEIPEDKGATKNGMTSSAALTSDRPVEARPSPESQSDASSSQNDMTAPGSFTEYTVEKDDTLQKISKKFYGSYGQWPKIYEANKDKIKSPDFLPQGIVIKIPTP